MTLWNDMIIGFCLLLLVWLLWKEVRRVNRLRLPARIAASVLAVVSLACLALPLSYNRKIKKTLSSREAILLTEGYDPDSLRLLLQTTRMGEGSGGEMQVFSALEDGGVGLAGDATADLARLHVVGYGLTRQHWAALNPPPLVFHPSPSRTGIVSVSWKQKLFPGEKCRVQGRVTLANAKPVKLLLTGMGMSLDSVVLAGKPSAGSITAGASADFKLNTVPAQVGRSVYQLWVLTEQPSGKITGGHGATGGHETAGARGTTGGHETADTQGATDAHEAADVHGNTRTDTLEQESLPIEVLPAKKLKVLLLAASPDFENTFLANWLARNGHAVAIRTAISRGKWDKAYLNMPEMVLDPLTPSLLDKFDLIIADAAALQEGSETERMGLRRQVVEKGLGLIIKTDSIAGGWGGIPVTPLRKDSLSRVVVSNGIYGAGKVVFTTLNTTYSRMLAGAKKEYAAYWSQILRKAARASTPEEEWQFAPDLPRVNEPVEALLQTNRTALPQGQFAVPSGDQTPPHLQEAALSTRAVYLAQDPRLSFFWKGSYWPSAAGWQSTATLQGEPSWWYAWSGKDWLPLTRRERWKETDEYIAAQNAMGGKLAAGSAKAGRRRGDRTGTSAAAADRAGTDGESAAARTGTERQDAASERVPFPKALFYIAFLISCLFLWVERKI